jgi:hypothetical protein
VSQASKPKERKFIWVATNNFTQSSFVHEEQVERKKESLELVHPWREILEHVGAYLEHFGAEY